MKKNTQWTYTGSHPGLVTVGGVQHEVKPGEAITTDADLSDHPHFKPKTKTARASEESEQS